MSLTITALEPLPEVTRGCDLAPLIAGAAEQRCPPRVQDGDVVVVAHKIVSKAEGRVRRLSDVEPGERARSLAREHSKDPRHVQVVLDESRSIVRAARGVLICETHHGFICANAGVDASNVPGQEAVVLLPADPDASARALRRRLAELTGSAPGVLVTDSFGRAWRQGQCDIAIGCAGIAPLQDWRGKTDAQGRELRATWIATIDQLAAAADLARSKDAQQPAILIRGAQRYVTQEDGPGARALIRPAEQDLFR
jgi:coenzyme F420-0:L-glutamate ligase/coenzyme F420-1:gamma-L-glutamate ligase